MRKLLAIALSVALVIPLPAVADHCRTTTFQQAYVAPVYAQKIVQHQVYDYNQIIVPKAFQVQVAAPFYMGVADDYRQANFARQVAEELLRLQANTANGQALTQKPQSRIAAILATNCAGCHGPGTQQPDLSGDPESIPELARLKSFAAVTRGEMPKGKPPLAQNDFDEIGAWAKRKPNGIVPVPIPPAVREPEAPAKEVLESPKKKKK